MEALIATTHRDIPGFGQRPLTYADFLACARAQGITVDVHPYLFDEYRNRRGRRPRITLTFVLAPLYKAFVGFHSLGH